MDYKSTISGLYYLVVCADGKVNERELALGRKMFSAEGFEENELDAAIEGFKARKNDSL